MKREQQHGLSHERVMPKKIDFNSITDAGEMFDAIMRDVRDRKKLGEDVTFKTHEFKDKWKNLRDQNIANTPITPEQKRVFQEQKAEKDSLDIDLNEKSRMQEERDKSTAMELSRKISGNELNLNRINGILSAMNEKLMDFKGKADALEDLGFFKKLLQGNDIKIQMDSLYLEIKELQGILHSEFKITDEQSAEAKEAKKINNILNRLDAVLSSKPAQIKAKANWAVSVAALAVNLIGAFGDYQDAHAKDGLTNKTEHSQLQERETKIDSEGVVSEVSGYAFTTETLRDEKTNESVGERKIYTLTKEEAKNVKTPIQWMTKILAGDFIKPSSTGKISNESSTKEARDIKIGAEVSIMLDGDIKITKIFKKGDTLWNFVAQNLSNIEKIARRNNVEIKNFALSVSNPIVDQVVPVVPKDKKIHKKPVIKRVGENVESTPNVELTNAATLDANNKLEQRGNKFSIGKSDYTSPRECDAAIKEMTQTVKELTGKDKATVSVLNAEINRLNVLKKQIIEKIKVDEKIALEYINKLPEKPKHSFGKSYDNEETCKGAIDEFKTILNNLQDLPKAGRPDELELMKTIGAIQREINRLDANLAELELRRQTEGLKNEKNTGDWLGSSSDTKEKKYEHKFDFNVERGVKALETDPKILALRAGKYSGILKNNASIITHGYNASEVLKNKDMLLALKGDVEFALKSSINLLSVVDKSDPSFKFIEGQVQIAERLAQNLLKDIKGIETAKISDNNGVDSSSKK